jgi:hypothetical protein
VSFYVEVVSDLERPLPVRGSVQVLRIEL